MPQEMTWKCAQILYVCQGSYCIATVEPPADAQSHPFSDYHAEHASLLLLASAAYASYAICDAQKEVGKETLMLQRV